MSNDTQQFVWTKEKCADIVHSFRTKKEIEDNYPEVVEAIKKNKWFYLYSPSHLGKKNGEDLDQPEPTQPKPTQPKPTQPELQAQNLKKKPSVKTSPTPLKKQRKAKTYKLLKYQPLSFTLNVGRANNLTTFDPDQNITRAIRHCPNTKTIWLDEQNHDIAVVEPIVFIKGFFYADERMGYTQDFIDAHPKLGQLFEEVDAETDAREMVDIEDKIIDIKSALRDRMKEEGGIEQVRAIVSVLNADVVGAAKMTPSEIRFAAYQCVDSNPQRFLDDNDDISIFDDQAIKRTAIAQHAFISGVIQVSPNGRQVVWSDTKKPICAVPVGLSYLKVFSDFLASDEGLNVAQEITKR